MYGYGWRRWAQWPGYAEVPAGYRYIGPCRCGWGPHAFFVDPSGRVVHASALWGSPPAGRSPEDLRKELEALREEKVRLEKRIQELEELEAKKNEI